MATRFQVKRNSVSGTKPTTVDIANAELAINVTDGKMFSTNGSVVFEIGANLSNLAVNSTITVGTATLNSTIYTGTANNANNLGGSSLSTIQGQITGNAATAYSNAVANAAALYQTTAGLSANVATLAANSATYLGNSSGTVANIASWVTGNAATAYSNAVANAAALYQTTAGLSANVATLAANSATYLGNSSGTVANIASWVTGNAATAYTNATVFASNASNINTGTLANARLDANVVNTSAAFTITGIHTHQANILMGNTTVNTQISNATILISNATSTTTLGLADLRIGNTTTNVVISNTTSSFGGNLVVTGTANVTGAVTVTSNTVTVGTAAYHVSNGNFGINNSSPAQKLDVTGNIKWSGATYENVFTVTDGASVDLDPANGTIQLWTLGASRTPTANNFANGQSMTLMVDDGTAYTITWTTIAVTWKSDGGVAPTLNTTGYTTIVLWKAANTVYGARVGNS